MVLDVLRESNVENVTTNVVKVDIDARGRCLQKRVQSEWLSERMSPSRHVPVRRCERTHLLHFPGQLFRRLALVVDGGVKAELLQPRALVVSAGDANDAAALRRRGN